jgi:hypothetical protein
MINGAELLVISIYGPNNNDINFFSDLKKILSENRDSLWRGLEFDIQY